MKDTLRKKRATGSGSEFDVTSQLDVTSQSQSSESASPNPWASETSSAVNGDAISRQVSKTLTSPSTKEKSQSPPPVSENGLDDANKPARRRKTVTKTPHIFELENDLNSVKPKEQPQAAPTPAAAAAMTAPASADQTVPPTPTSAPKKKKRVVTQTAPPPDATATVTTTAPPPAPAAAPAPAPVNSTTPVKQASPQRAPPPSAAPAPAPVPGPTPAPPKQTITTTASPTSTTIAPVNPFTTTHRTKKSQSVSATSLPQFLSNPCRFTPPLLPKEAFHGKVILLTNGASQTGQAMIRHFHAAGCRVIFGDTNSDQARKFISSLGPPHVVHFNKCDMTSYGDILGLFKLAVTMYGRVDHAIFGVGDDGGHACTVGEGERGWFDDRPGINKTPRMAYSEVETEPSTASGGLALGDLLTASTRFARIALAYLKYSPRSKSARKPSIVNPYAKPQADPPSPPDKDDRSLTFVTSIAAFKETPLLPIYQTTQHALLGLVRSLRSAVDPDPERDGVRVNAVVSNVMVPRATATAGGRSMSVQLPPDRPEDIARIVVGVVATNSSTPAISSTANTADADGAGTGITNGGGIWYEKGHERGIRERFLHGRILYAAGLGTDCWDIQEGLDRSEAAWVGARAAEAMARGIDGLGASGAANGDGGVSSWILDVP